MRANYSNRCPEGNYNNQIKQIDRQAQVRERLQEKLKAKKEANTFVSGITCRKCNATLPPHLMCDHLNVEFMENFHKCERQAKR